LIEITILILLIWKIKRFLEWTREIQAEIYHFDFSNELNSKELENGNGEIFKLKTIPFSNKL
jgi:hypothetical protein